MAVKLSTELRREVVTRVVIVPVVIELQLLFVLLSGIPFCSGVFGASHIAPHHPSPHRKCHAIDALILTIHCKFFELVVRLQVF